MKYKKWIIRTEEEAQAFLSSLEEGKMYTSTHTHAYDQFDSMNEAGALCAKLKELGAEGFVLTQHGVMTGVDIMRKAAAALGLKFVPGVETYYKEEGMYTRRAHLILIAADDEGYHVLCMAISDSQDKDGKSVMTEEILRKYFGEGAPGHGHVFATSACVQGVCGAVLRTNEYIQKDIDSAGNKIENIVSPDDAVVSDTQEKISRLGTELDEKTEKRNLAKKTADAKFTARIKNIEALEAKGDPSVKERREQLEKDMALAEEAKKKYAELKAECERIRKRKQALEKDFKQLQKGIENYKALQEKTEHLRKQLLKEEDLRENAKAEALKFRDIFGKNRFFIELQNHGIDVEAKVYPVLADIAKETGIPVICANDVHTLDNSPDELLKRRIMRAMRFQKYEEDYVGDDQLYPKSDKELADWLLKILDPLTVAKALANTRTLFDMCNVEFKVEPHYPVFDRSGTRSAEDILDAEVARGVVWRFPDGFPDERYEKRLHYEMGIIKKMGYANYHLVVKDYLEMCRALAPVPEEELENAPITKEMAKALVASNPETYGDLAGTEEKSTIPFVRRWTKSHGWKAGIAIGPGRGSAVGSLVCYVLGITSLDPIKYGLLFERFLNPERVTMPDIDSDIANRVRPYAIRYVQDFYGQESVSGIITVNAIAPRGTIRTAAKYYDLSLGGDGKKYLSLADALAKKVPKDPYAKFDKKYGEMTLYESLREVAKNIVPAAEADEDGKNERRDRAEAALEILRWAKVIEGLFTSYGAHAAGIVISDGTPIKSHVPLRWNDKLKLFVTQYDMVAVEEQGLLKMDFLGLKTLDVCTDALRAIAERMGIVIDLFKIPLDDEAVYREIFQKGRTNSVFQFESPGMKSMLKQFRPTCFEDLIILVSMYRPGPMQYLDGVISVKNGKTEPEYLTPELKPILERTYGAIVYQEQVMEIFQNLAGYTLGGADQVRRFMSKKKHDKLEAEREAFIHGDPARGIEGCVARGIDAAAADELFTQMTDFASYAFNKSHAAAYAYNSYCTAWLKYYYPAEFIMAAMGWAEHDKLAGLVSEARSFGVAVKAPDINLSRQSFSLNADGDIVFGFGSIKGVGAAAAPLLEERAAGGNFSGFTDFFSRVRLKKNALEAMVNAGCFDRFCPDRSVVLPACEKAAEAAAAVKQAAAECEKLEEAFLEAQEAIDNLEARETDITEEIKNWQSELGKKKRRVKSLQKKAEGKETEDEEKAALLAEAERLEEEILEIEEEVRTLKEERDMRGRAARTEQRLTDAQEKLESAEKRLKEAAHIRSGGREDTEQKMALERECLGAYITASPLDAYPSPEQLGTYKIEDMEGNGRGRVLGIATDVQEKRRKKDNKPMLFFKLEDRTGSVEVCVFVKQYERFGQLIKEGGVYIMEGSWEIDEDENGEEQERQFYADKAIVPAKKLDPFMMHVDSFAIWHLRESKAFEENYKAEQGRKMYILDRSTGKVRELRYPVKESAGALDNVLGEKAE